jgi:hypothetical protein
MDGEAVVEVAEHLRRAQQQVPVAATVVRPAVELNVDEHLGLAKGAGVRHAEHRPERQPPLIVNVCLPDHGGVSSVDAEGNLRVGAGAQHRQGTGVWVERLYLLGGEFEPAFEHVLDISGEERTPAPVSLPAEAEHRDQPTRILNIDT